MGLPINEHGEFNLPDDSAEELARRKRLYGDSRPRPKQAPKRGQQEHDGRRCAWCGKPISGHALRKYCGDKCRGNARKLRRR